MTNEHDSLKTLFQNTGIVKSINRGTFISQNRRGFLSSQFKNPVNVDKCMLILNFGDGIYTNSSNGIRTSMGSYGHVFSNVMITSTQISVDVSDSSTDGGILYCQVIEFY